MANPNETQQKKDISKDTNRNRGDRPSGGSGGKDSNQSREGMPGSRKPIDNDYPPMKVNPTETETEEDEETESEDTGIQSNQSKKSSQKDLGKGSFGGKPYGKKDDAGDRGGSGGGKSGQSKKDTSGSGQQMAYGDDEK
ncbi:MAG TPA: hypothetical protein VM286_02440 [Candidatus Thermoplasmatota archaeon]|nr:hypothetical protein [Candidatus Thermoplasmatota archaeon]